MKAVYLDYNATTPIDEEVVEFMIPFLKEKFGNPSSSHSFGAEAKKAINEARNRVALLINSSSSEIIFTSGGTESNNMALRGIAHAYHEKGNHIITSSIEHPAVIEVCKQLEKEGFRVSYLPVDSNGKVTIQDLKNEITSSTILVSIMHANNETGIIQPIQEISSITRELGIILHCDAAQSVGKIPVDVNELNVDLLSMAAHKFYGPKGIGALYVREGIKLEKILFGANHERNLRPGTENLLEIAGMGKAAEIALRDLEKNSANMRSTRDYLYDLLRNSIQNTTWNGSPESTLPNTLSISVEGMDSTTLISELPDIAISTGAACHAEDVSISYVLQAMKIPENLSLGTLRISTGKNTSLAEVEKAGKVLSDKINRLLGEKNPQSTIEESEIRLTRYTHGLGCACKISPLILEEVLKHIDQPEDHNILVGIETSDDASVYKIDDKTAIVQTVDFFTPVVDDPFEFGAITVANALSDIYAMGGKPLFGLNIVAFPPHRLPVSVLERILKGADEAAKEAGISIIGGHTIEDNEPKYGLVVSGLIHPEKILKNSTAQEGDSIFLTKKIGTGILSTALKRDLCSREVKKELYRSMRELNKDASEILNQFPVNSCTDITGFGLLGHLKEICSASKVSARIYHSRVPLLPGVEELAADGIIPGGTENNYRYLDAQVEYGSDIPIFRKYILVDAQTSGGLLFTVPEEFQDPVIEKFKEHNIQVQNIGNIIPQDIPLIKVLS